MATESRRTSSRATRAPQKFEDDAATLYATGAKRKRDAAGADEDEEVVVEENEDDGGEEEDEEEVSDEEEDTRKKTKRAKTTKKPAPKKAKVNGTAPVVSALVTRLPNRPRKTKRVTIQDDHAEGLYGTLDVQNWHYIRG
jgi:cohesin complex subunit SA-1/2